MRLFSEGAHPLPLLRRSSLLSLSLSLFLLLLLLPGCARRKPPVVDPTAAQASPSEAGSAGKLLASAADRAAVERAGEDKNAQQTYERAQRSLAELPKSDENDAASSPAAPENGEGEPEEAEPSPLDELPDTTPDVPQAAIEEERELIEAVQPAFDIPMVVNDDVLAWVNYFTTRHKEKFEEGLVRSGRYLPMIHRIFEEEGLPKDLAYMAHVESAYKVNAFSRAKAKGIFQFIAATGRRYGLRIDTWVDERSDPEKATRAAAAYLRDLYAMFGDWYLALAAYNAGEGKVSRGLARTGQVDFWSLAGKKGALRRETQNYVPAILAATLISKDPGRYGFDFAPESPIAYDIVAVENGVSLAVLARCAGSDLDTMKQLNPSLRRLQTPPGTTTQVRVPVGKGGDTIAALSLVPQDDRVIVTRHQVRKGETLAVVARSYGVTSTEIRQANRMGKRSAVRAGEVLVIPNGGDAPERETAPRRVSRPAAGKTATYRVRGGDTLFAIARQYGTTPALIASANGISMQTTLRVGDRLRIPGSASAPAPAAVAASKTGKGKGAVPVHEKPVVHTVRIGETLWRIADRYRVTVDALCSLNHISKGDALIPGTRLTIRTE